MPQAIERDSQQTDVSMISTSNMEWNHEKLTMYTSDKASIKTAALADLKNRVDDWKGHNIDSFGQLLLWGKYHISSGKGLDKPVRTSAR